jgi:hypothetical protein
MKDLHQDKSIILPSFEWHHSYNIPDELEKMCTSTHPHTWGKSLEAYGNGDLNVGKNQCFRHMDIQEGEWNNYPIVFTIVLKELKHEGLDSIEDVHIEHHDDRTYRKERKTPKEKSRELLSELQKEIALSILAFDQF